MAEISNELLTASKEASNKYGIPVSVILGFAGLETAYGTTGMGASKNNVFGIGSKTYSSVTESVEDFAKLVTGNKDSAQSKKYGEYTANASTTYEWIDAIREAGYNSEYADGVYEQKIMDVIDYYDLTQYDTEAGTVISSGNTVRTDIGLNWWGDVVITVFAILLLVMGVVFIGLGVTSNSTGSKLISKVAKGVKKDE